MLATCIFLCLCHVTRPVLVLVNCVCFDKLCFVGKVCINNGKYVFIVVKIKFVNSGNIGNICDKFNFTSKYTYFTTTDIYLSKTTYILQFFTPIVGL